MTDTKKDTWKENITNFFHNYFVGISHLECSEENCPIVDNWDQIEEKLSKKGLCALYKITPNNFLVVEARVGNSTDLGTYENIELTLPSGTVRKIQPQAPELNPAKKVLISGSEPKEKNQEVYLKDNEYVLFFNNNSHSPNLQGIEDYLEEMWKIKQDIIWDRDKSKKKVFLHVENDPSEQTQAEKIDATNKDYLFYIADPSITNEIKKMEIYSPSKGTEERQQLHTDYEKLFSEIRRIFGIRHLTSKKEERQNNPEIELNEAQFIALERRKKRIREKCLKEAESKGFCLGIHTLTYGTASEQRAEKVQEIKEIKELEEDKENSETENVEPVEPNK